ncbi:hypothetical protein B0H11DRAFT_1336791 [Mycena galericulata]|nr:hypothetical protein B0H11DRAFT_1336791 [Mycena galericulata]
MMKLYFPCRFPPMLSPIPTPHHMHRIRNILLAKKQASYPPLVRTSLLVPDDILLEIAHHLSISDVLKFSLTASHARNLFVPVLYRDVIFSLNRTCTSGLRMLARRPDVCTVIRGLTLHVNYADRSCSTTSEADRKSSPQWVVTMIERIAGDLKGLNKFWWVGGQYPPDGIWLVLRTSCPELKKIGCNTTTPWIEANTELFKFRNLTEFQLCINDKSAESAHEIPNELWAMLIELLSQSGAPFTPTGFFIVQLRRNNADHKRCVPEASLA